jgi:hypothetical protein
MRGAERQSQIHGAAPFPSLVWHISGTAASPTRDVMIQTGTWRASNMPQAKRKGQFIAIWTKTPAHKTNRAGSGAVIRHILLTDDDAFQSPQLTETPSASSAPSIVGKTGDAITLAEIQFGGICGTSGMASAFATLAVNDVNVLRTGGSFVGKQRAIDDPRVQSERWRYITQQSAIDSAQTLAYVFGRYSMTNKDNVTERGYFTRVWQVLPGKDGKDSANWRVVIDAATPLSRM